MRSTVFALIVSGLAFIANYSAIATGTNRPTTFPLNTDPTWANLPPVFFCGEAVPIHEEAVAHRLMSALVQKTSYGKALANMRLRASAFFPIIEPILERYKIPADFKYLPLVESALRGGAVSKAGAVGYWQLMPATARELGLTVDSERDERLHLLKSTDAACRYLRFLYHKMGSWTLAAAAYNNGIGNLLSSIRKQNERDYYYLRLNAETGRYLYRIIAFKELFDNYQQYKMVLPVHVWNTLSAPLPRKLPHIEMEVPLLEEETLEADTEEAVSAPIALSSVAKKSEDVPLPNAADVFRGGIKARLDKAGVLQRGQVWVFHLTRDGMADGKPVDQGDVLYAVVEDIDPKTNKVYFRADKVYSASDRQTHKLALSAVDASTGRIGINLLDMAQVKSGWISTWKVL